jgi:hypothetical protein
MTSLLPSVSLSPTPFDVADFDTELVVEFDKSVVFDFDTGEYPLEGGNLRFVTERDNVIQWIRMALQTQARAYAIYSNGYGSELIGVLGKGVAASLIPDMLNQFINQTLLSDDRIISVETENIVHTDDYATADLTVTLTNTEIIVLSESWKF